MKNQKKKFGNAFRFYFGDLHKVELFLGEGIYREEDIDNCSNWKKLLASKEKFYRNLNLGNISNF